MEELFLEPGKMKTVKEEVFERTVASGAQPRQLGAQQGGTWGYKTPTSLSSSSSPLPCQVTNLAQSQRVRESLCNVVQSAEISLPGHRVELRRVDSGRGRKGISGTLLAQLSSTELLFKICIFLS